MSDKSKEWTLITGILLVFLVALAFVAVIMIVVPIVYSKLFPADQFMHLSEWIITAVITFFTVVVSAMFVITAFRVDSNAAVAAEAKVLDMFKEQEERLATAAKGAEESAREAKTAAEEAKTVAKETKTAAEEAIDKVVENCLNLWADSTRKCNRWTQPQEYLIRRFHAEAFPWPVVEFVHGPVDCFTGHVG